VGKRSEGSYFAFARFAETAHEGLYAGLLRIRRKKRVPVSHATDASSIFQTGVGDLVVKSEVLLAGDTWVSTATRIKGLDIHCDSENLSSSLVSSS
jgi:hypothetical protein